MSKSVLDIEFDSMDFSKRMTIREYCYKLLYAVIEEGEGFSGKRPFGNSGWDFELFRALMQNGYGKGTLDEYGDIVEVDPVDAAKLITKALKKEFDGLSRTK